VPIFGWQGSRSVPGCRCAPLRGSVRRGSSPWLLDATEVETWARALSPEAQITLLPEASHFFHGRLHEVRDLVEAFARQAYIE
jgi:alpha/beta superfamily hydrolase